jgi:mannan endo-1,4-beta-mannosidase
MVTLALAACGGSGGADDDDSDGSGGNAGSGGAAGARAGTTGGGGAPGKAGVVRDGICWPICPPGTTPSTASPDWGSDNGASCIIAGTATAVGQACITGQPLPPPDTSPHPGVVRDGVCFPLCEVATMGTPDAPDWGYEAGHSCVIPNTSTAIGQMCMTGQPLPSPDELCRRPGVVTLDSGGTNQRQCSALCEFSTNPALDPEGDDWAYEYSQSCVIPGSPTASNQACLTCDPVPPSAAKPGVVVKNGAGVSECVPVCSHNTDPAADPELDGWAYEDNSSCVIPGTATAITNLPCTTGAALPEPQSRPGVEVRDGEDGELRCIATCTYYTSPTQAGANDDGRADDWAWEASDSCIIPGTLTAHNTPCATLMPLPPPEPRPGIMVNGDPVMDSCKWSDCVPLCRFVTEASDPEYPDWGWEDNNSCVIPGSTTATVIPKAVENHGYAVPPRNCTWGEAPKDFLAPPALDAARTVTSHFQANGAEIRDPYGAAFLIRGVNNSHAWYDICGQYAAYDALDDIKARGANAVRVGWAFESIDPGGPSEGDPEKTVIGTNPELLAEILHRIVELQMIPILAVNDTTGQTTATEPARMATFLTSPGYKEVLLAYEAYLMVGIANELNVSAASYASAYNTAISQLRTAGINHTLVITGNDWGQGCDSILDNAASMIEADPLHNLLFDIHIYNYLTYQGGHGGTAQIVQSCMDSAASARIPFLVGEFGHTHGEMPVQWQTIVARADANAQGLSPWLWYGDTEYPALNMNETWEGPLTSWGTNLGMLGGTKATIFP